MKNNSKNTKHPGEYLLNKIKSLDMSQKELAIRTGVSEKHISTVISGEKAISPTFARKLSYALGEDSQYWLNLQYEYDKYLIEYEEENGINAAEIAILDNLKEIENYFLKTKVMHNDCGKPQKVMQLRSILRVSNLCAIPKITYNAAYRAQVKSNTKIDQYVLFAWQRLCEIETDNICVENDFNRQHLKDRIVDIKNLLFEENPNIMIKKLRQIFKECGVALTVVHHFRGAPVQGFIKKTENNKIILCLTIRGKKADRFWFSLFHEIGHLLNGDFAARFVDFDSVKSDIEEKADIFARDTLIDPDLYKKFISSGKYSDIEYIKRFSEMTGVPYWITIGRLHNDEWLDWSYWANEAPSYIWK